MPVHLEKLPPATSRPTDTNFNRLRDHANTLEATVVDLRSKLAAIPPPLTMAQIQKALSAGGTNPLNLTGLVGTSQATAAVSASIPGPGIPPQPAPVPPPGTDPPQVPVPRPTPPPPPGHAGGDGIALADIVVVNSPPLAGKTSTGVITSMTIDASGFRPVFSTMDTWPDVVPPGWTGPLEFTLWMVLKIGGQWYASGVVQFWRGLGVSGGPPQYVGDPNPASGSPDWFYDARWGAMNHYQPAPGEMVGLLVTAGNQRNNANDIGHYSDGTPANERSNIILIPYPPNSGQVYTFTG